MPVAAGGGELVSHDQGVPSSEDTLGGSGGSSDLSCDFSFAQVTDLVPCVFAIRANESVPAGPSLFFLERFPAVRTASFSAKNTIFKCEIFCFSHRYHPYIIK